MMLRTRGVVPPAYRHDWSRLIYSLEDITEQNRAAMALRESEAHLSNLAANIPGVVYQRLLEPDGTISFPYVSTGVSDIHGFEAEEIMRDPQVLLDSIHPNYLDAFQASLEQSAKTLEPTSLDYELIGKSGDRRWVRASARPHRLESGAVLWDGILLDITEQKRAEAAQRKSEVLLAEAQRIAHVGNWERSPHSDNLYWSDECFRVFGFEVGAMVPTVQAFEALLHPDDRKGTLEAIERTLNEDAPYDQEYRIVRPDGAVRDIHSLGQVTANEAGKPIRMVGTIQDITERQLAEKHIRDREKRLTLITENLPGLIAVFDREERVQFANQTYAEWFRMAPEAVVGKTVEEILGTENYAEIRHEVARAVSGERVGYERVVTYPDGVERTVYATYLPEFGEDKTVRAIYLFVQDITERRRQEEQLRQAMKMEAVGQLTGGIAHDFNNLLSVILTNLQLMERNAEGRTDLLEDIAMAVDAAEQGAVLTQQLLAFSRKQALKQEVVDVNALLSGMSGLLDRTLGESIEISTQLAGDLWNTKIDKNQLRTAILNLAVNARDAMEESGQLSIATNNLNLATREAARLELEPGEYVSIEISDTGAGMPESVKARAFEPFYTTKEVGEGSGLGLSMVYGFVTQSGGQVKVDSAPGRGTTVTLYLPCVHEDEAAPADAVEKSFDVDTPHTILIVEDNPAARRVGGKALAALGYRTVEAENGEAALAVLDETPDVALIFTDISMPGGMRGSDLAREALRRRPDIKVLFTSGYEEESLRSKGHLQQDDVLIRKPYRIDDLGNQISKLLEKPGT